MGKWKNAAACDVANLILGVFLVLSPWLLHFAPGVESWNAWAGGGVIAVLSIAALSAFAEWEEWLGSPPLGCRSWSRPGRSNSRPAPTRCHRLSLSA